MSAMIYKGKVSPVITTDRHGIRKVTVRPDKDGQYTWETAYALWVQMVRMAMNSRVHLDVAGSTKPDAEVPVLKMNHFGRPYVAVVPAIAAPQPVKHTVLNVDGKPPRDNSTIVDDIHEELAALKSNAA